MQLICFTFLTTNKRFGTEIKYNKNSVDESLVNYINNFIRVC